MRYELLSLFEELGFTWEHEALKGKGRFDQVDP